MKFVNLVDQHKRNSLKNLIISNLNHLKKILIEKENLEFRKSSQLKKSIKF